MERTVRVFPTHAAAAEADRAALASMSPQERLNRALELHARYREAWERRVAADLDGAPVWIISRADLTRNKRATGRTQDMADAERLEQLAS